MLTRDFRRPEERTRHPLKPLFSHFFLPTPATITRLDIRLRRAALYPAELQLRFDPAQPDRASRPKDSSIATQFHTAAANNFTEPPQRQLTTAPSKFFFATPRCNSNRPITSLQNPAALSLFAVAAPKASCPSKRAADQFDVLHTRPLVVGIPGASTARFCRPGPSAERRLSQKEPMMAGERFLTPEEVSDRYRGSISIGTLRNWRAMRVGPTFIKIGKAVLYPVNELDAWDEQNKVPCRSPKKCADLRGEM